MRKEQIKNIMVVHSDNDFIRVWEWIGEVTLSTMLNVNTCSEEMLEESDDIENFIVSLLPTAIEFCQYRTSKYEDFCRYRDIDKTEVDRLTYCLKDCLTFKYNFDETDEDWLFGGSECLVIDVENKKSYVH